MAATAQWYYIRPSCRQTAKQHSISWRHGHMHCADLSRAVALPELAWLVGNYFSKIATASRTSSFMSLAFKRESAHITTLGILLERKQSTKAACKCDMISARWAVQTSHFRAAICLGIFLGMTRDVHWRVHSDVSWRDTSLPVWPRLVTTHVSQFHVVMICLEIDEHSAYIGALAT